MKRIVLATVNSDHLIRFTDLLQRNGYRVVLSPDARSCISMLGQREEVDAVIVDYQIPDFPGLMAAMRSLAPVSPPVIAISDRIAVSDYLVALSYGVLDFFFLPLRPAEFLRSLTMATARLSAGAPRHPSLAEDSQRRIENSSFLSPG